MSKVLTNALSTLNMRMQVHGKIIDVKMWILQHKGYRNITVGYRQCRSYGGTEGRCPKRTPFGATLLIKFYFKLTFFS